MQRQQIFRGVVRIEVAQNFFDRGGGEGLKNQLSVFPSVERRIDVLRNLAHRGGNRPGENQEHLCFFAAAIPVLLQLSEEGGLKTLKILKFVDHENHRLRFGPLEQKLKKLGKRLGLDGQVLQIERLRVVFPKSLKVPLRGHLLIHEEEEIGHPTVLKDVIDERRLPDAASAGDDEHAAAVVEDLLKTVAEPLGLFDAVVKREGHDIRLRGHEG